MAEDAWNKTHLGAMRARPPWSPTDEDIGFVTAMAAPVLGAVVKPRILVLGLTARLVQIDWPARSEITAVDFSPGMIASTWNPHPGLASRAVCAPWQHIPIDDHSIDLVVGDGSLNALPTLADYSAVFAEMARILKPGGAMILRCFQRPDDVEEPGGVVALARAGEFPTTAAFRFRFCLALTGADGSVELGHLHSTFNRLVPDRGDLAHASGWPRSDIDRVDVDAGSKVRFTFPTSAQLGELCAPYFGIGAMRRGTYTQSEQCPTVLFQPTQT